MAIVDLAFDAYAAEQMEAYPQWWANPRNYHAAALAFGAGKKAQPQHPDDAAVDRFAAAMKAKLAEARAKGRGGWDEPGLQQRLSDMLRDHVDKGDPCDVANFACFLWNRREGISPRETNLDVRTSAGMNNICAAMHFKDGQGASDAIYTLAVEHGAESYVAAGFAHTVNNAMLALYEMALDKQPPRGANGVGKG